MDEKNGFIGIRIFIAVIVLLSGMVLITPSNKILTSTNHIFEEEIKVDDSKANVVKLDSGVELIANSTKEGDIKKNTTNLQKAIDEMSEKGGGIIQLPAGTFYFAKGGVANHGDEDYAIRCRNNVHLKGAGTNENSSNVTILKPYYNDSTADGGMDMFYFNNYADTGYNNDGKEVTPETKRDVKYTDINNKTQTLKQQTVYLINADFSDFIVDGDSARGGIKACGGKYKTDGKGFMINLFKDCDWNNVVVKNTDATGFGVDCPLNSTMTNCKAINCGKAALQSDGGASGFGIGTGYSNDESLIITNCIAINNKKFGFFFEHQSRFSSTHYPATTSKGFVVSNSIAGGNMYDFGGLKAYDVTYENIKSISGQTSYTNSNFKSVTTNSGNCKYSVITYSNSNSIKLNQNTQKIYFSLSSKNNYVINSDVTTNITDITSNIDENKWAINKGIISLNNQTTYGLKTKMTRFEIVNTLWKYKNMPGQITYNKTSTQDISANKNYITNTIQYTDLTTKHENDLDAIIWAYQKGIISKDTKFNPDRICTRAEFITMLYRLASSPSVTGTIPFGDVSSTSYYYNAVVWGYQNGIIKGSTSNTFNPLGEITKQEVAIFLYRYNSLSGTYQIVYNLNEGTASNPKTYNSTSALTLKNPTKTGYTFEGWTGSNGNTPTKSVTIKKSTTGDLVYTANWKANISKIEVKTKPNKLSYYQGEKLNTTGLILSLTYTNSDYDEITGNYSVSPQVLTNAGTQKVTITYQGKTTSYNVDVKAVTLESISISTNPKKLTYYPGETIDTTGLVLNAKYNDGSTKKISTGYTTSPTTLNNTGTQKITVTYQGKTTSYEVTVNKNDVKSIGFKTLPTRTDYYLGEKIDTSGLVLKVMYNNGTTKEITKDFTIDKTTATTIGTEKITISYAGKTLSYTINVKELKIDKIAIKSLPKRINYLKGDTYTNNGLSINIYKSDGFIEEVISNYTTSIVEGTILNNIGKQTVTVTYQNQKTSFEIEVSDPKTENLILVSRPNKTNYIVNEKFDPTGLKLQYIDSKGNSLDITQDYTLSLKTGTVLTSSGTIKVTATYNNKTVDFNIEVKKAEKITVVENSLKDEYQTGEDFDNNSIQIEVEYDDGTKEIINSGYEVNVEGGNTLETPGEKEVEITYGGTKGTANINVEEKKGETDDKTITENKKENTKESNKLIIFVPVIIIIIVVGIILFLKFKKVNEVD